MTGLAIFGEQDEAAPAERLGHVPAFSPAESMAE
jgi:hypothetical protein